MTKRGRVMHIGKRRRTENRVIGGLARHVASQVGIDLRGCRRLQFVDSRTMLLNDQGSFIAKRNHGSNSHSAPGRNIACQKRDSYESQSGNGVGTGIRVSDAK